VNTQPSPDWLSTLKYAAQEVRRTDGGMSACRHFQAEIDPRRVLALIELAERSIELSSTGFRNDGINLIVRERKDNADPHYRWCKAVEALETLE
jgi:hypothetical protein